jgi:hypothetical protein
MIPQLRAVLPAVRVLFLLPSRHAPSASNAARPRVIRRFARAKPNSDCAGSELVVLVFEQDVERGERSVTARDILLQVELVCIAQFVARVHLLLERTLSQLLWMLYVIHV